MSMTKDQQEQIARETGSQPKHAGGRPTKYTTEMIERAREYADVAWQEADAVPMIVGLALYCGIAKQTVYDWAKDPDKKEFSDIVTRVELMQEQKLVKGGLCELYNPVITKLLLSKHGYSDKQEIDHTTKGESINRIERVIVDGSNA